MPALLALTNRRAHPMRVVEVSTSLGARDRLRRAVSWRSAAPATSSSPPPTHVSAQASVNVLLCARAVPEQATRVAAQGPMDAIHALRLFSQSVTHIYHLSNEVRK
jgi:hypothetical protein